jgi:hypothetical protein
VVVGLCWLYFFFGTPFCVKVKLTRCDEWKNLEVKDMHLGDIKTSLGYFKVQVEVTLAGVTASLQQKIISMPAERRMQANIICMLQHF